MEGGASAGAGASLGLSVTATPVEVGQRFPSKASARLAVETELARDGRAIKNGKSVGGRQLDARCQTCSSWFVRGCKQATKEMKITAVCKNHVNCAGGGRISTSVVKPLVDQLVRANPKIAGKGIKRTLKTAGFDIHTREAQRAKKSIVTASRLEEEEAIARIPALFEAITRDCPGSVATLEKMAAMATGIKDPDQVDRSSTPTLSAFVMRSTGDQELAILMHNIALCCKSITRAVRKAGIAGLYGLAGTDNSSGDHVKKLDILSNDIMINALTDSHMCAVLVSEENEEPIIIEDSKSGKYCVAFDPLDGSSNIDCNVSTGTIFAVYDKKSLTGGNLDDVLRAGVDIKVAGYCMYGSATELVLTFYGSGVHRFTLDPSLGEFIHIQADVKIPSTPKNIYSCNEGNFDSWDEEIKRAVMGFKCESPPWAQRYVGSMVSDVHRTLLYGGLFLYPADKKSTKGKLRVLYEGFPMALIIEQAGGMASTGMFNGSIGRVLEISPKDIHERCPIIIGNPHMVERVLDEYKK